LQKGNDAVGSTNGLTIRIDTSAGLNQMEPVGVFDSVFDDNWHYLVFYLDSGDWKAYKDGSSNVSSGTYSHGNGFANTNPLHIGANAAVSRRIDGLIDEVRIYNRALSADEVMELYRAGARKLQPDTPFQPKGESGLVGYWSFNGQDVDWASTTAEVLDRSGEGNNGNVTNFGAEAVRAGISGQALDFDGTNDHITHGLQLPKQRGTIAHWLKPDQLRYQVAVYESDGTTATTYNGFGHVGDILEIHTSIDTDEWICLYQDGTNTTGQVRLATTADIVAGQWAHVVVTWNRSGNIILYINGIERDSADMSAKSFTSKTATVKQIGRTGDGTEARHWDGAIDEVRIYNRALSADEVMEQYRVGARKFKISN